MPQVKPERSLSEINTYQASVYKGKKSYLLVFPKVMGDSVINLEGEFKYDIASKKLIFVMKNLKHSLKEINKRLQELK